MISRLPRFETSEVFISEKMADPSGAYNIKSKVEGKLDDFFITYTEEDLINETTEVIVKDKYTFDKDNYIFWCIPVSIKNTAKSFDSVYNGSNFVETLEYYNENLYFFGESERKAFSRKILDVIDKDKDEFFNAHQGILEGYENLYNKETGKFDVAGLDDKSKEILEKIKSKGIYDIVKVFFTTEGVIDDCGFGVQLKRWAFEMIKPAYNDVVERFNPNDFSELKPFYVPQICLDEWIPVKQVTKTNIVYPNVYVNSIHDVYRLEGKETWKTNLLLPIELADGKEDEESESETELTNKINFPTSETVNGEDINYGDYYTVIIPMYNGIYYPVEDPPFDFDFKEYELSYESKSKLHFVVFGKFNLGGFTLIKDMNDEGTFYHIGETIEDSIVTVYCDLPTDFSNIKVTGSVYINGQNYKVEFRLDDMRDILDYKILKYISPDNEKL